MTWVGHSWAASLPRVAAIGQRRQEEGRGLDHSVNNCEKQRIVRNELSPS